MTKLPTFASRAPDVADETPLRRELVFVVPGRLDQLTGGYLFDRHIVEGLRARGRAVRVIELTGGRPKANAAVLAGVADGTETVVDGLALANLGEVVAAQARRLPVVAFVHGPLAQESGLPPAEAKRAAQREAALLSRLRGVLCPSRKTAAAVESYGVSPDRIAIRPTRHCEAEQVSEAAARPRLRAALRGKLAATQRSWRAGRGAGPASRSRLEPALCRVAQARSDDGAIGSADDLGRWARGAYHSSGRVAAAIGRARLSEGGRLCPAVPPRRLRHGFCGSNGARPAADRYHRRRDPRDGVA
jgi:hypothetical protein